MSRHVLLCFFLFILTTTGALSAPPTVTIESGPELSSIQQRPTFTWSGIDADGTVAKYYYGLNTPTPTTATTGTSFTPATDLDYGTYTFYLQAEDNDGERSEISSYVFVVKESPNLLKDGDFSATEDSPWRYKPTDVGLIVNEQCILSLSAPKKDIWDASIGQYKIPITRGEMYEVSFKAKASSATTILWIIQHNGKWTEYGSNNIELTPTMQNYSYRFMMSHTTDPEACFFIQFGHSTQQIILDDVAIKRVTAGTQYKIAASVSGEGSITPAGNITVFEGTNQSFKIQSDNNALYPLVDLIVDGESVDSTYSYTFEDVKSNHSIQAVFGEKKKFTITTSAAGNNGGGISSGNDLTMGVKEVIEGSSKSFTISTGRTSSEGAPNWSVLKDVIVDGVSKGANYTEHTFDDISQNHTIVAVYEDRVGTPNLIEWGAWQSQCDEYGSHLDGSDYGNVITLNTNIIRNGVASDRMDLTTEGVHGSNPWGQIACNVPADPTTKLTGLDHIVIEYAIGGGLYLSPAVVLYDPSMGEGYSYRSPKLYAYGSEVNHRIIRDTIAISEFTLPAGAPNRTLDLSKVSDILVHTRSINNQGWTWMKPQIYDLRLYGYTGGGYTTSSKKVTSSLGSGSGTIAPLGEQEVEVGAEKIFYFSPEAGHRVKEVRVNGGIVSVETNSYTFDNITTDQTIEVDFEPIPTFTIATTITGGTVLPGENIIVEQGDRQRITYSANPGYSLVSVTVDGVAYPDSTTSFTFDDVQQNHTVEIVYDGQTLPTYTVTATFNGEGTISPSGEITVNEGENLTFTIELNEDATFDSLKIDGTKVTPVMTYTLEDIRANTRIDGFASIEAVPTYTVNASFTGEGTISPAGNITVNEGDNLTFTFELNEDAAFDSLKVDGTKVTPVMSYTLEDIRANSTITGFASMIPVALTVINSESSDFSIANTIWDIGSPLQPTIIWEHHRCRSGEVALFDALGNQLMKKSLTTSDFAAGSTTLNLNGTVRASGSYLLIVSTRDESGAVRVYRIMLGARQ